MNVFFALLVFLPFAFWWQSKRAHRPSPVIDGLREVRYPAELRWAAALFSFALSIGGVFLATQIPTGDAVAPIRLFAAYLICIVPEGIIGWCALVLWCNWNAYNADTLVSNALWKRKRMFCLSQLQPTGKLGVLGHEFRTPTGDTMYVNSYQVGAPELIELLSKNPRAGSGWLS